ncbi:WD repeat-containing protein WDS homolog isoform X1 [Phoenix dactylifera]|uniref:WD repeat-containing protein WDS homolog isoform X1 n=1 Tax=Phoenix dactylifera TaxID=42345 RepID=A0A8B7BEY2_PHODC|nr:WD repeat-containing protein WDS homolog isoform X1 [Phoenix dactylifera]
MEGDENSNPRSPLEGESSPRHPNSLNPVPPMLGREGLIDRTQFVRIIIQALYSLGYRKAAAVLELDSGVQLDSPEYTSLLFDIMAGRWDECVATINSIDDLEAEVRARACFLVWKEQFLELLGSGDGLLAAKDVLWKRIAPLDMDRRRVHKLARSLISSEGIVTEENRVSRRIKLLLDLVELLPPWVRVPSGRLEHLVETTVLKQAASCFYHNSPDAVTLYADHECSQEQIPSKCIQTLCDHKNEVWFVQFSNNGVYLATSSRDCTAIIWTVKDDDTVSRKHILEGHMKPISFVAWSPDDMMLLTCGNGEALKLWDVETGMCKLTFTGPVNRIISSCAWFPNSDKIVCGSCEPDNCIFTCDLEGKELEVWEGERMPKVSDLAVTPDGCCLISICSSREIWIRDFPRGKERFIHEDHSITSLSLSRDGQSLIVNLNSEEIHLWNVNATSDVPDKFRGHKQGKYVIRSCFGGSNCLFIASGSEDSQIYIWQRHHEMPIKVLSGHSKTVNSVSWNPMKPHMLASASDDETVRIWVANRNPTKIFT